MTPLWKLIHIILLLYLAVSSVLVLSWNTDSWDLQVFGGFSGLGHLCWCHVFPMDLFADSGGCHHSCRAFGGIWNCEAQSLALPWAAAWIMLDQRPWDVTGSLSDWVESGTEVTVILSVYKFETHVKHVAGPPLGRRRQSKQDGRRCVRVQDVQDFRKRTSLGDF